MACAIDTDGTRSAGTTALTTGEARRECATGLAQAGGQVRGAVGAGQPVLGPALEAFLTVQQREVATLSLAFSALGRNLSGAALSTLDVEMANAAGLGSRGRSAPAELTALSTRPHAVLPEVDDGGRALMAYAGSVQAAITAARSLSEQARRATDEHRRTVGGFALDAAGSR